MDLRHARTFVAVADLGTVSRAAERLHVAQPALSRQIAELERMLGVTLFDRVGRRLLLTGVGEQLLRDCRALLSCAAAVEDHARQLQGGEAGVLKLAASPQIIEGVLSAFLPRYAARYPAVELRLSEVMGWSATAARLEAGEIDLGQNLVGAVPPDDPRFACHPLEPIGLLAAFGASVAIEDGGRVDIARLATHPLLLLDAEYVFRRNFDAACRLAAIRPRVAYESRTPHTLLAMAEGGHGVAIVPSVMRTDRYRLRVAAVTFRGKPLRERPAIYWDRRRTLPRYATAFCEMLGAQMRDLPSTREARVRSRRR
ncbi:LysR family transcriptional regulator [Roseomonas rosulenta]|uniref:LysR family transcriptional regulator n=1 Tax=Roseomonas rosulenta TaxID=2748667 RepID=UPI0018DF7A69|nr:LysR family transcriptional regulator [Roseomonas rosulenta]